HVARDARKLGVEHQDTDREAVLIEAAPDPSCSHGPILYPASSLPDRVSLSSCITGATVKIDIFPHIMPRRYFDRMLQVAPPGMPRKNGRWGFPVLVDAERPLRIRDR